MYNQNTSHAGEKVHVRSYTRDGDTHVQAYERAYPGQGMGQENAVLHGGVSYNYATAGIPWNTPISLLENSYLFGKGGLLTELNNRLNKNYHNAADLMNIAIWGTKNLPSSHYYKTIKPEFNQTLSQQFKINIPNGLNGVIFSNDSSLANNICNNNEFLQAVREQKKYGFINQQFPVTFNSWTDKNMFRALHNATVINPHIDKNGYFNAFVYDKYDFAKLQGNPYGITGANNAAYYLQQMGAIENYYILVPIKMKLPF